MTDKCKVTNLMNRITLIALLTALISSLVPGQPNVAAGRPPSQELPMSKPEQVGMSSERLGRIRVAMQRYVDRNEVPGVVTLVARRGRIVHLDAIGYRDVENKAPMTTDTIFRIASMTKPIASVALMMLYEEGHLLLSDPVSKWLPEFKDMKVAQVARPGERVEAPYKPIPAARPVTIKHLLTHTAGLPNSYRGITQPEFARAYARQRPDETIGDVIKRLAKLPLNFQPGEAWEYGPATDVIGRLVEVISGKPLDVYLQERIFEPLGMRDTYFYLPVSKVGRFAANYQPDSGNANKIKLVEAPTIESRWIKEPHVYFSGAGGLLSTAADYFRFHQMMLNGGELNGVRILGRKTVELMTVNHIGDLQVWLTGPGYGFGLGYSVVTDVGQAAQPVSIGTYGWGGAFCTYFWVDPVEEVIGIVMTQVRPYTHLNIRQEFQVLVNQAIVDSARPRAQGTRTSQP
ncbi:MAG TPA: serine hydrolase domain-containing protein [Blastocatellia bacterium]|nr:serine hydrolase domain-containing protein [Blastocatellia bacterium]